MSNIQRYVSGPAFIAFGVGLVSLVLPFTGWLTPALAKGLLAVGVLAVSVGGILVVSKKRRLAVAELQGVTGRSGGNGVGSPSDYTSEWEHYDKMKEAILGLRSASSAQVKNLSIVIQRERTYLDDDPLQDMMDKFMSVVDECARLGISVDGLVQIPVISATTKRMHKRYRR